MDENVKINWKEKFFYGMGDLSANILLAAFSFYLLFFMVSIGGLKPALASLVFLVAKIRDAITDVWMGRISDNTKSKFGKRRVYMIFGAVPFGSLDEHLAAIKEFAEKHPELDVIQGAGFIPTPDMGPDGPPAELLDPLTDKPVVPADIGHHSYWVNHAAMDRLGIDKNTPDVSDGIITRDDAGNPTGYFREGAMDLLKPLTVFTVEQHKQGFLYYQEDTLMKYNNEIMREEEMIQNVEQKGHTVFPCFPRCDCGCIAGDHRNPCR